MPTVERADRAAPPWPQPVTALRAAPAAAVLVASFLPWTERGQHATGAPTGLIGVVALSIVASAAFATRIDRRTFRTLSLLALAYAWTCMASAAGFSSSAARRLAATVNDVDSLQLRAGFYVAALALAIASTGWVIAVIHTRRQQATRHVVP